MDDMDLMKKIFFEKEQENLRLKEELRNAQLKKKKTPQIPVKSENIIENDGPNTPQCQQNNSMIKKCQILNKARPNSSRVNKRLFRVSKI